MYAPEIDNQLGNRTFKLWLSTLSCLRNHHYSTNISDLSIFNEGYTPKTCDLIKSYKQVEVTRDFPRGDQVTFFEY